MTKSHPYISGAGSISTMIEKLRKNFPQSVTSKTVQQYGLAKNNESSVINALQFIGVIDDQGNPIEQNKEVFLYTKDEQFHEGFSKLIKEAYSQLFTTFGDSAWTLNETELLSFFRPTDNTSELIGKRQAKVFQMFAALSGKIEPPTTRTRKTSANSEKPKKNLPKKSPADKSKTSVENSSNSPFDQLGMSIKIDVNLPSDASRETYDNIFRSIRENLING